MMGQFDETTGGIKSLEKMENTPKGKRDRWAMEVAAAEKALTKFQEKSRKVVKRFTDERDAISELDRWFNIFNTNVQIMQASLYANIPSVDVTRAHTDTNDDIARVAAKILQRAVMHDSDAFDSMMVHAIEDRLVPGLGMAFVRLEIETEQGEDGLETLSKQEVGIDYVYWQDVLWSPCKVWEERRWVGRRVMMTYDALVKRFGEEKAKNIPLDYKPKDESQTDDSASRNQVLERACVYEIWDREAKQVVWFSKGCAELLDIKDDPMGLDDFEPFPKPLFANTSTTKLVPKADYVMLQDQYLELDTLNNRISLLAKACKVVGVYDRGCDGAQKMLQEGTDNTLVPVDNWAMFAEKGGLKGVIDFLPLDVVVNALKTLTEVREIVKAQIYELTGISDIVRGNTKASETLGAQDLKAKFASVRIQKLQDEVAKFAEKVLNIKAELMCKYFSPDYIAQMANVQYFPEEDQQYVPLALELLKAGENTYEWRIKIRADSMAQIDWERMKTERSEFMNAVATFLQSASTVGQGAPQLIPLMLELLKFGVSGFKISSEVEGIFDRYISQFVQELEQQKNAPPQPSPEEQKAQAEMQMDQQRFQMEQQGKQTDMQMAQAKMSGDLQMKQADHQLKLQAMQQELVMKQQEHELKMEQMREEHEFKMAQMVETARTKASTDAAAAASKLQISEAQAESNMAINEAQAEQQASITERNAEQQAGITQRSADQQHKNQQRTDAAAAKAAKAKGGK